MAKRRDVEQRVLLAMRHVIASSVLTNDAIARNAGLALVDSQVLNLLSLGDQPMTAGALSAAAGLPSSTTTRVVDRLERAGYVVRSDDPKDRRKVYVEPVPQRVAELAREYDQIALEMQEALAGFSMEQLDVVARLLEGLSAVENAHLAPRSHELSRNRPGGDSW